MEKTVVPIGEILDTCGNAHEQMLLLVGIKYGLGCPDGNRVILSDLLDRRLEELANEVDASGIG